MLGCALYNRCALSVEKYCNFLSAAGLTPVLPNSTASWRMRCFMYIKRSNGNVGVRVIQQVRVICRKIQ
jgi:hypothetical protein